MKNIKPLFLCSFQSYEKKECFKCLIKNDCLVFYEFLGRLIVADHKILYAMGCKSTLQNIKNSLLKG